MTYCTNNDTLYALLYQNMTILVPKDMLFIQRGVGGKADWLGMANKGYLLIYITYFQGGLGVQEAP